MPPPSEEYLRTTLAALPIVASLPVAWPCHVVATLCTSIHHLLISISLGQLTIFHLILILVMQISSQERLQLLTDFAEFLCDVAEHQETAYYCVISGGNESVPSSLCHLCRLSDEEFSGLLIAANLAANDIKNRKLSIAGQWCKFIDMYDLSD